MFHIVIQAGGESKRMGQDKGLTLFLGKPLIQRVYERMKGIADEVIIVTNRPQDYQFLGIPFHEDLLPGRGALGGLYTALNFSMERGGEITGIIACDMPFASPELMSAARRLLVKKNCDAVIPRTEHGAEPFHAIYRPAICLLAVKAALEADLWKVDSWFPGSHIYFMGAEEYHLYDPLQLAFYNVNTQADLQRAETVARERDQLS
jgi:molybdopterin-guanine dinucleotide biosynthesis protein A